MVRFIKLGVVISILMGCGGLVAMAQETDSESKSKRSSKPSSNSESITVAGVQVSVRRLGDGPIIHADLDPSIGVNIQGPSLIKVPDWVEDPLGKYYLYFADHKGSYIRLAYADELSGPWKIHVPGSLQLAESHFLTEPPPITSRQLGELEQLMRDRGIKIPHDVATEVTAPHIASPDVHIDHENQQVVMYYHGLEALSYQTTRVATSTDGIHFVAHPDTLGRTYFRAFAWDNKTYGLAMPGQMYRGDSPFGPFIKGPMLFNPNMRHCAVFLRGNQLWVFWTQVGDAPEHIKLSKILLRGDWMNWQESEGVEILRPQLAWEGANAPQEASMRSTAYGLVNQYRDPAIYVEDDRIYMLYTYGGESGIALAEVTIEGA